MPKQVYDEGRVVGLSAYEIYVKQALSTTPNIPVATEREWLSSTIANGASMLLKISPHSDSYKDYVLPANSRLIAANTIIASFMYGVTASFSGDWATQITSYGKIAQAPASETTVNKNLVNTAYTDSELKTIQKKQMQYIKISDGVVYQNGKWKSSGVTSPKTIPDKSDMKSGKAVVRISFSDAITEEFYVLLTGFVDLQVAQGVSGLDTSVNTNSPQNGDFLGPATFPWMSKIWFATPGNLTYALKMGLNGGGMPNVEIVNDKDSISTIIKVMNNITTEKSVAYLDLVPVDANGNKITDATKKKYAAGYKIEIDGSKLLDDTLSPGYGIDIVDSSNQNNSQGTPKKVVKTNISSTKGSGITISQPTDANKNKSGSVVQNISTNLNAGTGIQIGNKTGQGDSDTSKTIATNILVGNGLQINKLSSKDDTGAQTISHNLVNGTGVVIGTRAELGVSTTAITNNGTEAPTISGTVKPIAELKLHDTVRYDDTRFRWDGSKWLAQGKASNATTGRPTIIYSNLKSDGSISITPASASTSGSAQVINTNLKPGVGIDVNNTTGAIKSTLKDGNGTKVTNGSASGTSGGNQQVDINLKASTGVTIDNSTGTIGLKLNPGNGIAVVKHGDAYDIINTKPMQNSGDYLRVLGNRVEEDSDPAKRTGYGIKFVYKNGWYTGNISAGTEDDLNLTYNKTLLTNVLPPAQIYIIPQWTYGADSATLSAVTFKISTYRTFMQNNNVVWTKPMCRLLANGYFDQSGGYADYEYDSTDYPAVSLGDKARDEQVRRSLVFGIDLSSCTYPITNPIDSSDKFMIKDLEFGGSLPGSDTTGNISLTVWGHRGADQPGGDSFRQWQLPTWPGMIVRTYSGPNAKNPSRISKAMDLDIRNCAIVVHTASSSNRTNTLNYNGDMPIYMTDFPTTASLYTPPGYVSNTYSADEKIERRVRNRLYIDQRSMAIQGDFNFEVTLSAWKR